MKMISIASGKGGVGKTTVTCHLALALAEKNKRVLILDGDLGMSNVDIVFGVKPQRTISDLLDGDPIQDCITPLVKNVDLLAGGSGLYELVTTNSFQRREVIQQIESLSFLYDYVLIDTAPGLHDYVLHLNAIADECLVVITPDPSSLADAYALIKVMHQKYKTKSIQVICNLVTDAKAEVLFARFSDVIEKFLNIRVSYLGFINQDEDIKRWQHQQRLNMRQTSTVKSLIPARPVFKDICDDLLAKMELNQNNEYTAQGLRGLFSLATGHA